MPGRFARCGIGSQAGNHDGSQPASALPAPDFEEREGFRAAIDQDTRRRIITTNSLLRRILVVADEPSNVFAGCAETAIPQLPFNEFLCRPQ